MDSREAGHSVMVVREVNKVPAAKVAVEANKEAMAVDLVLDLVAQDLVAPEVGLSAMAVREVSKVPATRVAVEANKEAVAVDLVQDSARQDLVVQEVAHSVVVALAVNKVPAAKVAVEASKEAVEVDLAPDSVGQDLAVREEGHLAAALSEVNKAVEAGVNKEAVPVCINGSYNIATQLFRRLTYELRLQVEGQVALVEVNKVVEVVSDQDPVVREAGLEAKAVAATNKKIMAVDQAG